MGDTQQPQPAGTGTTGDEAAAELAEIQRRQGQVIKAVLVPVWYWWAMAAGIVAIGAARDSGDLLVQAIAIPLAVLVMVVLTGAMIPEVRRRVRVYSATQTRCPRRRRDIRHDSAGRRCDHRPRGQPERGPRPLSHSPSPLPPELPYS